MTISAEQYQRLLDALERLRETVHGNGRPGITERLRLVEEREGFDVQRMERMEMRQDKMEQMIAEQQKLRASTWVAIATCVISALAMIFSAWVKS